MTSLITDAVHLRIRGVAQLLAFIAAGIGAFPLISYAIEPAALTTRPGVAAAMAPLTAVAIIALVVSIVSKVRKWPRIARLAACIAALIALSVIAARIVAGEDVVSLWAMSAVFGVTDALSGKMSFAAASCLLLLSIPLLVKRECQFVKALNVVALAVSGVVLLGYAYAPDQSQALSALSGIALPTAVALLFLSHAAVLSNSGSPWLAAVLSPRIGGQTTRRQLLFLLIPVAAGAVLAAAVHAGVLEIGAALAIIVAVTIVPFALLIVRDGRAVEALDVARDAKTSLQVAFTQELQLRLASQATALNEAAEKRAQADAVIAQTQRLETVGQLTGGIAHDFNNLLMAISANLELLRRAAPDSPKAKRYSENALLAVAKGSKLTGQLLTFSRSQRLTIQPVELHAVLENTRSLVTSALGPDIALQIQEDVPDAWVMADAEQLESALVNLALNAKQAMPDGGRLTIQTSGQGPQTAWVVIRVTDSGTGMTPEVKARATEPFFTTREVGKGTGLGLSQVYGLVRQCQGELYIDSEVNRGASIEMRLKPAIAGAASFPIIRAEATLHAGSARGVILVVDDDHGVRGALVEVLQNAGFDVVEACDGVNALHKLETVKPIAAVLDFIMPGMNGAELARRMKIIYPQLPIIFVSGYSDTVALDGISDAVVLRKPFAADRLTATVSSLLH